MDAARYLTEAMEAFEEARRMTYDLLAALPPEGLARKFSRPDLDTFGKHFQELGDTQACYSEAISRGEIDFASIRDRIDYDLVGSADRLEAFLRGKDAEMSAALGEARPDREIRWPGGETVSLVEHLSRMTRHETFHHGQFVIFAYEIGLRFPESWVETWALPSKPGGLYRN